MSTTMGVKLDDETQARLRELGKVRKRSPHWLMKEAIDRYLDVEERYEREKAEDQARWDRYMETGIAIPHEEVMAKLDERAKQAREKAQAR